MSKWRETDIGRYILSEGMLIAPSQCFLSVLLINQDHRNLCEQGLALIQAKQLILDRLAWLA
jgi:hypothetical protein